MSENTANANGENTNAGGEQQQEQAKSYTQDEVNRIVAGRLKEQAEKRFGDYDDLKARAEGAKTVEQQLADLAQKHAAAEARALRADIAGKYGISAEDRDLFLTGSDEAALEAQAKRLSERTADQKKNGNRAPKEGATTNGADASKDLREFSRSLFASAKTD